MGLGEPHGAQEVLSGYKRDTQKGESPSGDGSLGHVLIRTLLQCCWPDIVMQTSKECCQVRCAVVYLSLCGKVPNILTKRTN